MIRSFRDKDARRIFEMEYARGIPVYLQDLARQKLVMLDAAMTLQDLKVPPGNRLERLNGDRFGQYSIRINRQFRVCFIWRDGDAYAVEIVDYH